MAQTILFDFASSSAVDDWHAIDDRVMGGVSQSRLRHDPAGHAVFEGVVSLEHNGGFASVRSAAAPLGRPGARILVVEARGETRVLAKHFKVALFTDDGFDSPSHQATFTPRADAWENIRLPLAVFRAMRRGRELSDAPMLDPARIRQVGLLIAARQAGPFALFLRRIWLE